MIVSCAVAYGLARGSEFSRHVYGNTRARAMRTFLIKKGEIESIVKTHGYHGFTEYLARKKYIAAGGQGDAESMLNENLILTVHKVKRMCSGQGRRILGILLGKWDVENIKVIVRGIRNNEERKKILELLVPIGELDSAELKRLAYSNNLRELAERIGPGGYGRIITENANRPENLEDLLDRYYFESNVSKLSDTNVDESIIKKIMKTEIDVRNLKAVCRGIRVGMKAEDGRLIRFGSLPVSGLLGKASHEELLNSLSGTKYHSALKKGLEHAVSNKSLLQVERELESLFEREKELLSNSFPLSIAPTICYLSDKEREIRNLRITIKCKAANMPESEIRNLLT